VRLDRTPLFASVFLLSKSGTDNTLKVLVKILMIGSRWGKSNCEFDTWGTTASEADAQNIQGSVDFVV
jgi:hypothetical protein